MKKELKKNKKISFMKFHEMKKIKSYQLKIKTIYFDLLKYRAMHLK